MTDQAVAAWAASLDREIVHWQRAEAGTQQVTLAQHLATILAAMPDWALVTTGWRDGMVALANQYEAEIERLRAALAGAHRPHRPDCAQDRYPGSFDQPPDPCTCGLEEALAPAGG